MPKPKIFIFILLSFWCVSLHAKDGNPSLTYKVVSVLDGDTFNATDENVTFRVRIAAMDAPEKGQPCAKMAKYRLEQMLQSKNVTIKPVKKNQDRYGRVLGHVFLDGQDIALLMIQEGLATYYRPFCHDYPEDKNKYNYLPAVYIEAEKRSKKLQKNIWSSSKMELPCRYRHPQR